MLLFTMIVGALSGTCQFLVGIFIFVGVPQSSSAALALVCPSSGCGKNPGFAFKQMRHHHVADVCFCH